MSDLHQENGHIVASAKGKKSRQRGTGIAEVFFENKLALVGAVIIVAVTLFCFVGPLFYHTNQVISNLANANNPPSAANPLGTDNVGYDVLGRLMVGGGSPRSRLGSWPRCRPAFSVSRGAPSRDTSVDSSIRP